MTRKALDDQFFVDSRKKASAAESICAFLLVCLFVFVFAFVCLLAFAFACLFVCLLAFAFACLFVFVFVFVCLCLLACLIAFVCLLVLVFVRVGGRLTVSGPGESTSANGLSIQLLVNWLTVFSVGFEGRLSLGGGGKRATK